MEDMREDKDLPKEDKKTEEEEPETQASAVSRAADAQPQESAEEDKTGEETKEESEESETEEVSPEEGSGEDKSGEGETEGSSEESETEEVSPEKGSGEDKSGEGESEKVSAEEDQEKGEEEPKAKRHYGRYAAIAAAVVAVIGAAAYIGGAQQYKTKFFPNTTINYIDVSNLTVDEVKNRLAEGVAGYTLNLVTRTGDEEITGQDIGLAMEYDDSMENWLKEQNPYLWGLHLLQDDAYTVETMVSYDPDMLDDVVADLACMDPSVMVAPVNAAISDYDDVTGGYTIIPEVPGTVINKKNLTNALGEAVLSMRPELVLADTDVYEEAAITSDNAELLARLDEFNQYAGMTVIYHFGDETEVLDGNRLHECLITTEDGTMDVDREAVEEYVKYLAEKYDTTSQARTLKTTSGPTVTISKGTYGWKISQSKETDALVDILLTGEGGDREPIYQQTAASRGENDYGNTYVEINLTAQHLYYYKNGSLVVESDLVSGNESNGHATPDGVYPVAYKQTDRILRGERRADGSYEYESHVNYWMPFNGGIGLHDALWRGSFGGSIYKTNGSHGCINLPYSVAKTIYENIEAGCPVLCYRLGSTEPAKTATSSGSSGGSRSTSSSSSSSSSSAAAAAVQETVPAILPIEETASAGEAVEVPAETAAPAGSSNVIVAGQSRNSSGPGAQQVQETSPVIAAGSSQTAVEEPQAAIPAEIQAEAPVQSAVPAETQAAVPVETQAAAPAETQAAIPAEVPAPAEAAPATAEIYMIAPGE